MVRLPVCETVRYYDDWVNGNDLRLFELAAGRRPRTAPRQPARTDAAGAPRVRLELEPYNGSRPQLHSLDSRALAPIKHVLVHGSMATQDGCGFSDVDIAVFVDDGAHYTQRQHEAAIVELRRLLHSAFAFDPLMHHGLMFAPATSLEHYDQGFLPIGALARARVLHGPRTLEICSAATPLDELASRLRASAKSLRTHILRREFFEDDYRLKHVLSGALLMPARVLAAQGTCVYKRDSFDLARSLFNAMQWEFIARCEALRALWKRPPAPLPQRLVPSRVHPHLRQVIGERMAPRLNVRRLSHAMIEGLLSSAHRFLDRVEAVA